MSITTGLKKFKNHIKNGDGTYSLQSLWTSAQTVECVDGTTVEDKIGKLKGISTNLEIEEAGYAADMTVVGQLNNSISELQVSFSDARSDLIAALANLGITADIELNFDQLISLLPSLAQITPATATANKILSGYTAWVNGQKLSGTATAESLVSFKNGSGNFPIKTGLTKVLFAGVNQNPNYSASEGQYSVTGFITSRGTVCGSSGANVKFGELSLSGGTINGWLEGGQSAGTLNWWAIGY